MLRMSMSGRCVEATVSTHQRDAITALGKVPFMKSMKEKQKKLARLISASTASEIGELIS